MRTVRRWRDVCWADVWDCLVTLCGTRFDKVDAFNEKYREDGVIWFIESCDLNVMSICRALWQLEHAGLVSVIRRASSSGPPALLRGGADGNGSVPGQ